MRYNRGRDDLRNFLVREFPCDGFESPRYARFYYANYQTAYVPGVLDKDCKVMRGFSASRDRHGVSLRGSGSSANIRHNGRNGGILLLDNFSHGFGQFLAFFHGLFKMLCDKLIHLVNLL